MITTLTPNPCIDRTFSVEEFDLRKMNRLEVVCSDFGGKGINVSSALKNLGVPTCCLGFSFADHEADLCKFLRTEKIPFQFVTLPGKMRTCYKIFDRSRQHTIEMNEPGAEINPEDGERLLELVSGHATESTIFTLSGSLPSGLADDFYLRCVRAIHRAAPGCRILVDAEKKLLLRALEGRPSILKPNIYEFQEAFGCTLHSVEELDAEAKKVVSRFGLEILCVSLGEEGAYVTDGRESWRCRAAQVEVRSLQGAGDSLIAGMCLALEQKKPLPEVLHYGVAAAGDSISRDGTRLCTLAGLRERLKQNVELERL